MSGDYEAFAIALRTPKIAMCKQEELNQVLRLIMVKVGLRSQNWPSTMETPILIDHIRQNFGGHHLAEINLAFEMAIAGKLDEDATCYENFSCLYFSKIMNAYREWSREEYKNIRPGVQTNLLPYSIDPKKEFLELLELMKQDLKKGLLREEFVMAAHYDMMIKHGVIKSDFVPLSIEEKKKVVIEFLSND